MVTPAMLEMFSAWLAPIRAKLPQDLTPEESAAFQTALTQEALRRFGLFLQGVRHYQDSPVHREAPSEVTAVWSLGSTRLIDYAPGSSGRIVLVVPSLINRYDILDLEADHSFLRALAQSGLRPLVVDWGRPDAEESAFTIADYVLQRLEPALAFVRDLAQGCPVSVLGYCMGGLLALALALRQEGKGFIDRLALIATPWDFAAKGVGGIPPYNSFGGRLFSQMAHQWQPCIDALGYVPAPFLQAMFTAYQPLQILEKYMAHGHVSADDPAARRFVLTEDWLTGGVPLAKAVAQECLKDWYETNATASLSWRVGDTLIDPRLVTIPTYLLVPQKDRIVPPESARPLAALIPKAQLHEPPMGHIGVMSSPAAAQNVWPALAAWLKA